MKKVKRKRANAAQTSSGCPGGPDKKATQPHRRRCDGAGASADRRSIDRQAERAGKAKRKT